MKIILLENIRSAYNVWNVIRTADALGRQVRLSGYTPSPEDTPKVQKTSLWAEENVNLQRFDSTEQAFNEAKKLWLQLLASEISETAIALNEFKSNWKWLLVVFGNEIEGVEQKTLDTVDEVVYIPMKWIKESLNIGQSAAIMMWGLDI